VNAHSTRCSSAAETRDRKPLKGTSWLDAQHIAGTALYLNSGLAAKVTGVVIPVDAGHLTLSGYNPVSTR
jgi:enoyl-[acyl-carrier-protein] reductase (NADH)